MSALNGLAIALAPSWICFMLTECRFRYYVPVNVICSLPEFRFAQYVRKSALPTIRCLVDGVKRVCVFCFAKALRTVLDYWQFENLHSLSFAIAKQLLISIFSLGRRSVRYCSLQPCQNPLCRQSAFLSLELSFFSVCFEQFASNSDRV